MENDPFNDLLKRLRRRRTFDMCWETFNFALYEILLALSIIASFSAAIIIALGLGSKTFVVALTAIPGAAIVLDRTFQFSRRWRWHNAMSTRFLSLEQRLLFEGSSSGGSLKGDVETARRNGRGISGEA
jgi:hypothetical protein